METHTKSLQTPGHPQKKNYPSTWLLLQPGKTIHFHLPPTLGCDQLTSSAVNGFQLIFGPHHWKMYIRNCTETEKKARQHTNIDCKINQSPLEGLWSDPWPRRNASISDVDLVKQLWSRAQHPKPRRNRTRCHFLLVLNKIEKKCNFFFLPFSIFQFVRNG